MRPCFVIKDDQMYKQFLGIVVLVLFTIPVIFLTGCSGGPNIDKCEAKQKNILNNDTTTLSVSIVVPREKTSFDHAVSWRQLKPENPQGRFTFLTQPYFNAAFHAPIVNEDTTFTIQATVKDKEGHSSTCDIVVEVKKEKKKTWEDVGKLFKANSSGQKK